MYLWQWYYSLIFQGTGLGVRRYGELSGDNQNFWDGWVTKFSEVWCSARAPWACRSSAKPNQFNLSIVPSVIHLLWNLGWWCIHLCCRHAIKRCRYLHYKLLLNLICYNDTKYGSDISPKLEWIHRTNNDGNFLRDPKHYTWGGSVSYLLSLFVLLPLILICRIRKTYTCVGS